MKAESRVLGSRYVGNSRYPGRIKVRLAHWRNGSLLVPDQVYLESPAVWFQPLTFLPCLLTQLGPELTATLYMDVDGGQTLRIDFKSSGLIARLEDGSCLYKATVHGPRDLPTLGQSTWTMFDERPYLRLFHHTTQANKDSILATGEFWPSVWNLSGTRKLKNVRYAYFTSLAEIRSPKELAAIGMSPSQVLYFARDGVVVSRLPKNWRKATLSKDILELPAYWSLPEKRDRTVSVEIDCTLISPPHVWRHCDSSVWHEVVLPKVFRVGMEIGHNLKISHGMRVSQQVGLKGFEYMIIGDATTLRGLAAPMDEEDTKQKFKVDDPKGCLLTYWFARSNQDLFSGLTPEEQELEPREKPSS